MDLIIGALQLLFILAFGLMLLLWVFSLLLAWSWAQDWAFERQCPVSFREILAIASIEWGALIVLLFYQLLPRETYVEAPPMDSTESPVTHRPIIFIPSLHLHSGLFRVLQWRLRKHHYKSLWLFDWPIFLKDAVLMERELVNLILQVKNQTRSPQISIVSFGSSRPIIGRALENEQFKSLQIRWLAISAPQKNCPSFHLFQSERWKNSLLAQGHPYRDPDELIVGERDTICYPDSVFESPISVRLKDVGHYGALLHSTTTQKVLEFLKRT